MAALNEVVLAACSKHKTPPIAIVYGVPKMDKKNLDFQKDIDTIIEKNIQELDHYLEVNGMKSHFIAFNEFKSTQISSVLLESMMKDQKVSKKVKNDHQDVDSMAAKVILDAFLLYVQDTSIN